MTRLNGNTRVFLTKINSKIVNLFTVPPYIIIIQISIKNSLKQAVSSARKQIIIAHLAPLRNISTQNATNLSSDAENHQVYEYTSVVADNTSLAPAGNTPQHVITLHHSHKQCTDIYTRPKTLLVPPDHDLRKQRLSAKKSGYSSS